MYIPCAQGASVGGVAFFVSNKVVNLLIHDTKIVHETVVEGRDISIKLCFRDGNITATNIYNHDLTDTPVQKIGAKCGETVGKAQSDPIGKNVHFTLGDLNFREKNELPFRIEFLRRGYAPKY